MVMCVQNVRIGVIRQTIDPATADADMMRLFEDALADLSGAGCLSFFFWQIYHLTTLLSSPVYLTC